VRVECFGCGAAIEAGDAEAVADRFVDHARDSHDWSYPEEAIRNYARNYAEAVERLSGGVERLPEIGEISVHSVIADRVDDWLRFFDRDASAGNPDWASCYCLEPHDPAPPERPERPWRETRSTMVERIGAGRTFGYLAYVDGTPAGWVNASPRSDYALYRLVDPEGPGPASWIEGYPLNDPEEAESQHHYRGTRSMYEVRRFDPIEVRERDTVMRRPAS
jgi:predicted small metal-binding protein